MLPSVLAHFPLLTSERSEEVPFFIAAFGPGKGVTAISGFLGISCLCFWSRRMKFGSNVYFGNTERSCTSFFGLVKNCERSKQIRERSKQIRERSKLICEQSELLCMAHVFCQHNELVGEHSKPKSLCSKLKSEHSEQI